MGKGTCSLKTISYGSNAKDRSHWNNSTMFLFKYWPVVLIPILYVGFYISLIYLKGDIVYRPYEDCNCMKEAAEKSQKGGHQKRPDQRLMEVIDERNKRYFKFKSQHEKQLINGQQNVEGESSQKFVVRDSKQNQMEQFLIMSEGGKNKGERFYGAFKMPYASLDHQMENYSSLLRRNCLKWSLVSGKVSCTQWREPELVYHMIPPPPFGFL